MFHRVWSKRKRWIFLFLNPPWLFLPKQFSLVICHESFHAKALTFNGTLLLQTHLTALLKSPLAAAFTATFFCSLLEQCTALPDPSTTTMFLGQLLFWYNLFIEQWNAKLCLGRNYTIEIILFKTIFKWSFLS